MKTKNSKPSKNIIDTTTPEGLKTQRKDMAKMYLNEKTDLSDHLKNPKPMNKQQTTEGEKVVSKLNKTLPFLKERSTKNLLNDDTFDGGPKQTFNHKHTQVTPGSWKTGKI